MESAWGTATFVHLKYISRVSPDAARPGVMVDGEAGKQNTRTWDASEGSGNSAHRPIHPRKYNRPFPTPIIISSIPPSSSNDFVVLPPPLAARHHQAVIGHKGDRSLRIRVVRET